MFKKHPVQALLLIIGFVVAANGIHAENLIPADNPDIQYFGRWDFTVPLAPTHSWPGVSVYAEFEGTSIGVKMSDNYTYYNVIIDGVLSGVFKGTASAATSYPLASDLADGHHSILLAKRSETYSAKYTFLGFVLDEGKTLLSPAEKPDRKIEFIGDSFTSAAGNEYTESGRAPDEPFYTNIYEGFGPVIARHYGAQYMMTSRSGYGMVMDWTGDFMGNMPDVFARTLLSSAQPEWDFSQWIPNLVVIGLGLNDYSGFGGWDEGVADPETDLFKLRYHDFISTVRDCYPGVKILAVAPHVEWIRQTVSEVVDEENAEGHLGVYYAQYDYYEGGYVNEGHPTVETHHKIADAIISVIDAIDPWTPCQDPVPPAFVKLPVSSQTIYESTFPLEVETDSYSTVRFSAEDKPYDQMENTFTTTGEREHSVLVPCEHGQEYTFYLRAMDTRGNVMDTSAVVSFSVDTTKLLLDWKAQGFDDSAWQRGLAPLGYGTAGGFGAEISPVNAAYFRKPFTIPDIAAVKRISTLVRGSDGIVVYLNGHEVSRTNFFADEEMTYETNALKAMSINRNIMINSNNGLDHLQTGENLIAVEVHVSVSGSAGLSFDAKAYEGTTVSYFATGSEWAYYDNGAAPETQLKDKTSGVLSDAEVSLPVRPVLHPNFPNPFNPVTRIVYSLPRAAEVSLIIYDLLGREVIQLARGKQTAGQHIETFDGSGLSSGVYLLVLKAEGFSANRKMLLMK